jgi:sugar lactone lactonase YvrE
MRGLLIWLPAAAIAASGWPGPASADLPWAIAIPDDVADRIMLFDPATGQYLRDLLVDDANADCLTAPFDCVPGPALSARGREHPDTVLISDLRRNAIQAFDATTGEFLRTFVDNITARGMAWTPDRRLLVASGRLGIRAYDATGAFLQTLVAPDPVDGPNNAFDVLVRQDVGGGEILIADATLDVILRFDLTGRRIGVFARLPSFVHPEQLALRATGNVMVADVFGNAVHEFAPDGTWVRSIPATRPRGVVELANGNLLISAESGVWVSDAAGRLSQLMVPGYPAAALRYARYLGAPAPCVKGDLNGDGAVNAFDVDAFALALSDPDEFFARYPNVDRLCAGDINSDGQVNGFDIDPFVQLIIGSR